jgi:hypothetical protein
MTILNRLQRTAAVVKPEPSLWANLQVAAVFNGTDRDLTPAPGMPGALRSVMSNSLSSGKQGW